MVVILLFRLVAAHDSQHFLPCVIQLFAACWCCWVIESASNTAWDTRFLTCCSLPALQFNPESHVEEALEALKA